MAKGLYSYTMIEQIKELVEGMTVYCDDNEDIVVSVKILTDEDENDFVIVELETSYLIAHNFDNEVRYFNYQILDSGIVENLEDDGYYFLTEDEEFCNKIAFREDNKTYVYKQSEIGAVYNILDQNDEEFSLCEYDGSSDNLLVIKNNDDLLVLQGVEIAELIIE
jgi:hypothetical protein